MAYPYIPIEQNLPEPPGAGGGQHLQEWFPYDAQNGLQPSQTPVPPVSQPHIGPPGVPLLPWCECHLQVPAKPALKAV